MSISQSGLSPFKILSREVSFFPRLNPLNSYKRNTIPCIMPLPQKYFVGLCITSCHTASFSPYLCPTIEISFLSSGSIQRGLQEFDHVAFHPVKRARLVFHYSQLLHLHLRRVSKPQSQFTLMNILDILQLRKLSGCLVMRARSPHSNG